MLQVIVEQTNIFSEKQRTRNDRLLEAVFSELFVFKRPRVIWSSPITTVTNLTTAVHFNSLFFALPSSNLPPYSLFYSCTDPQTLNNLLFCLM